ncbi:MAG TPA: hypothetical protein PKD85_17095 [Saprospiraceae bacterium]|mgnify:CR=1 FL=1|nr:hypothetical protein [Saprospiraceae bacterium]
MSGFNISKKKSSSFYTEFILATVLSILAAGLWRDLFVQILPEKNLVLLTLVCILITAASIFLLKYLFSDPEKISTKKLKC